MSLAKGMGAAALIGMAAGGFYVAAETSPEIAATKGIGCTIKGNIASTGERIYHVPGGEFYGETQISSSRGERWFCTETEAWEAGWRRSKR